MKCLVCGKEAEQHPAYNPKSSSRSMHQAVRHVCFDCALKILAARKEFLFTANYCDECKTCPNIRSRVQHEAELIITQPATGGLIAKKLLAAYFKAGWLKRRRMRKAIERYLEHANL